LSFFDWVGSLAGLLIFIFHLSTSMRLADELLKMRGYEVAYVEDSLYGFQMTQHR
jgi:hypothetical protein